MGIQQSELLGLIRRTLGFLERQSFLSETCKIDRQILQKVLVAVANDP